MHRFFRGGIVQHLVRVLYHPMIVHQSHVPWNFGALLLSLMRACGRVGQSQRKPEMDPNLEI
jgi:hypothetical protein